MEPRWRIYYTEAQKALMWDRWQKGESLHAIARLFGRHHTSIREVLARNGGIRPAPRRRSCRALTLVEREEISRSVAAGHTIRSMALSLRRAPSTISCELMRNGAGKAIGRARPIRPLGRERAVPSAVNWRRTEPWRAWWPRSSSSSGRPSRLPAGSSTGCRTTSATKCHLRRSTAVSLSKPVAR